MNSEKVKNEIIITVTNVIKEKVGKDHSIIKENIGRRIAVAI